MRTLSRQTLLATLGLAAIVTPVLAQRRIEITPFVGGLIPTAQLGSIRVVASGSTPTVQSGEIRPGGVFGGRVTVYGPRRLGLEATYFMSGADVRVAAPFLRTYDAEVQGGSIKAVYEATAAGTGTDLVLSAGVGAVNHSGEAFKFASDQFDVGGVFGGGLHVVMSPMVTLRFDGDLYVYRWSAGPGLGTRTQSDLVMTAGLGLRLGR